MEYLEIVIFFLTKSDEFTPKIRRQRALAGCKKNHNSQIGNRYWKTTNQIYKFLRKLQINIFW